MGDWKHYYGHRSGRILQPFHRIPHGSSHGSRESSNGPEQPWNTRRFSLHLQEMLQDPSVTGTPLVAYTNLCFLNALSVALCLLILIVISLGSSFV